MRDIGRAVTGDAQRRNLVPQVQARLAHHQARRPRRFAPFAWALAGAGACAALAAFVWLRPQPLSFAVAGETDHGRVGAPIVAPPRAPLALSFSDASAV